VTLQRLVLTFDKDAVTVRVLYRSKATSGPGPSTKARRREVTELARAGLREALAALDADDVILVGTSGFETREDTLSVEGRAA
jgi:hypothetical protein